MIPINEKEKIQEAVDNWNDSGMEIAETNKSVIYERKTVYYTQLVVSIDIAENWDKMTDEEKEAIFQKKIN